MGKHRILLGFVMTISFLIYGCEVLLIGGGALGTGTGTYFYVNGEIQGNYSFPLDKVWTACEKTMADLRAVNVQKTKAIGSGKMSAIINDVKIELTVKYEGRNKTVITIREGLFGNETASKFLYQKIRDNISEG